MLLYNQYYMNTHTVLYKHQYKDYTCLIIQHYDIKSTIDIIFINSAFVPSFMLMLSLYLFSVSYLMYVNEKKNAMYLLFILGILLIFGSLIYTGMRIS